MSLGFGSPWLLLLGLTAALPLLLHLLRRRQPLPTDFPPLELLLLATARQARRRRLRRWLLLATRCLLLGVLAAIVAGPSCRRRVPVPAAAGRDQAAVVILDDSFSMGFRRGGGTLFARAKERARALLAVFPVSAPVALLTTSGRGEVPELALDRERLRRAVAAVDLTSGAEGATEALARARALLEAAPPGKARAIYLITDLTRRALPAEASRLPAALTFEVIDVAGAALPNRAVVGFAVAPGSARAGVSARQVRRFEVTVENATGEALRALPVSLRQGEEELARGSLDLAAGATGQLSMSVSASRLAGGAPFLEARLPGDDLPADDRRLLPLGAAAELRVLVVDGDPRESRHDDELFFLEAALRALAADRGLALRVVAAGDLPGLALHAQDVVLLCNLPHPERAVVEALTRFVNGGGGLLVTLGSQVSPEAYNLTLGRLLPGSLRSVRAGGGAGDRDAADHIALASARGAVTQVLLAPPNRAALAAARIERYGLVQPGGHAVLLRLTSGAPLLLERRLGRGRVLLWASSIDRDWTDLPLRPAFLPLVRALLGQLMGHPEGAGGRVVQVGQPQRLSVAPGETALVVVGPGGLRERLGVGSQAAVTGAGPHELLFTATDRPGAYRVFAAGPDGGLHVQPDRSFVVVLDPAESDLARLEASPGQAGQLGASPGAARAATLATDLTASFAALCLLLLVIEGFLAARFIRPRRQPS